MKNSIFGYQTTAKVEPWQEMEVDFPWIPDRVKVTIFTSYLQIATDIFGKSSSAMADWGTFTSNAVVSGITNALSDTLNNYDAVKEFFRDGNEAMIIAATMTYIGMDTVGSMSIENKMPRNLQKSSKEDQRQWLHRHISIMLNKCHGRCGRYW